MHTVTCREKIYTPTKIVCVGKNFSDHIVEMGGGVAPSSPTIFIKPNSSVSVDQEKIEIPASLGLLHHEVELCFLAGKTCKNISEQAANSYIAGFAVGVDFTLRDLQAEAKKNGGPWALAKGFDSSAVFGEFFVCHSEPKAKNLVDATIKLFLNGELKQSGKISDMIFSPAKILSYVSKYMTIEEGDVFMCGTPAGVGEVKNGDEIRAEIETLPALNFTVDR